MLPKTHGIMVAGTCSCISAAWIRSRVVDEFDPSESRPCRSTLIEDRLPLAIAGLGFTGLSTVAAQQFDKRELYLLADQGSEIPPHQQLNNHRELHSLPYVGGAVVAAHLIRHSVTDVGRWIAEHLGLDNRVDAIIRRLGELADWVINSLGTGVFGHILGDIPTKRALQFLRPITDRNLALNLVKHGNQTLNKYLQTVGWMLAGGAWTFSGIYLCSWKPPEKSIKEYFEKIAAHESANDAIRMIREDIVGLFAQLTDKTRQKFRESSLFSIYSQSATEEPHSDIFNQNFDTKSIWGIDDLSRPSIQDTNILPPSIDFSSDQTSLYSQERFEIDGTVPIRESDKTSTTDIFDLKTSSNLYDQTDQDSLKSLQKSTADQQSISNEESDDTSIFE